MFSLKGANAPVIYQSPILERVTEGHTAQLQCTVRNTAVTLTDVHWYREQQENSTEWVLTDDVRNITQWSPGFTQRFQSSRDSSNDSFILTITNVQPNDTGVYYCKVWGDISGNGTQLIVTNEGVSRIRTEMNGTGEEKLRKGNELDAGRGELSTTVSNCNGTSGQQAGKVYNWNVATGEKSGIGNESEISGHLSRQNSTIGEKTRTENELTAVTGQFSWNVSEQNRINKDDPRNGSDLIVSNEQVLGNGLKQNETINKIIRNENELNANGGGQVKTGNELIAVSRELSGILSIRNGTDGEISGNFTNWNRTSGDILSNASIGNGTSEVISRNVSIGNGTNEVISRNESIGNETSEDISKNVSIGNGTSEVISRNES
ncbi:hypothetical protein chiPu_0023296, partial [Chiloscyllium punctatum]|nr:hypothetical protein [Chiloscyllium punctatum]